MDRRTLLRRTAVATTVGIAGCLRSRASQPGRRVSTSAASVGSSETSATDVTATTSNGGSTSTAQPPPTVTSTSFEVCEAKPGRQVDEADVTVVEEHVVVEGTIWGADGCHTARLAGASYQQAADGEATDSEATDALAVTVEAFVPAEKADEACIQAIRNIGYRARVDLSAPPEAVVVSHLRDGERTRVTRERPGCDG